METLFGEYLNPVRDVGTTRWEGTKLGMHIVGGNVYVHEHARQLWQYEVFLFFLPTTDRIYHVACVALPKSGVPSDGEVLPIRIGASRNMDPRTAVIQALAANTKVEGKVSERRLNWIMRTIYKAPKVTLADVLHLPPYKEEANASRS